MKENVFSETAQSYLDDYLLLLEFSDDIFCWHGDHIKQNEIYIGFTTSGIVEIDDEGNRAFYVGYGLDLLTRLLLTLEKGKTVFVIPETVYDYGILSDHIFDEETDDLRIENVALDDIDAVTGSLETPFSCNGRTHYFRSGTFMPPSHFHSAYIPERSLFN